MAKRPFLLLYINDFLSSVTVMAMDDQQFAWYLKLLMRAWQNEPACHLPNDDEKLMMAAGCKIRKIWDRKKQLVLSNFDVSEDKNWLTNARLIGEYQRMCEVAETKAEAGRKSAAARQQKATSVEHPLTGVEQNSTTQMSDVIRQTKPKSKPSRVNASDPRHTPVKEFVKKCCEFKKVPFTWEGGEASALASFLKGNPEMHEDQLMELVRRRFNSKDPPGDRPRIWIGNLGRYATENGNHGNAKPNRLNESFDSIKRSAGIKFTGIGGDGEREPADRGRADNDLPDGLRANGSGVRSLTSGELHPPAPAKERVFPTPKRAEKDFGS